jgi:hypothetical protein
MSPQKRAYALAGRLRVFPVETGKAVSTAYRLVCEAGIADQDRRLRSSESDLKVRLPIASRQLKRGRIVSRWNSFSGGMGRSTVVSSLDI